MSMLSVREIERKDYVSPKNNKTYTSYKIKGAYKKDDGLWYGANVNLDGVAIEQLIEKKVIANANDLVGKEIQLARLYPIFLSQYEKDYGLKFDCITAIK